MSRKKTPTRKQQRESQRKYILSPRKDVSITGFRDGIINYGDNPLKLRSHGILTEGDEWLIRASIQSKNSLPILTKALDTLRDYENGLHRLEFTTYNENSDHDDGAYVTISPNGPVTYRTNRPVFKQGQGFSADSQRTSYTVRLTEHPKKKGLTGYSLDTFINFFSGFFSTNHFDDSPLKLEEFDIRVNLVGAHSYDARLNYKENDDEKKGTIKIYTPFSRSRRTKNRDKDSERALFFALIKDIFSVKDKSASSDLKLSQDDFNKDIHEGLDKKGM